MMKKVWLQYLALALIAGFALFVRVYDLKDVPAGLFCDEAAEGYNSYAIGHHGYDENGERFPLFIWSFGGYKNPLYIYSAIPGMWIFGADEMTTRLPAALFGVGSVIAIFFFGRALFGPWVGLFAAAMLSVTPWHHHFSRIAFDMTLYAMLVTMGSVFLVRFTEGKRTLPAALFCFALCVYAYAVAALFIPLYLVGFGLLYLPTLLRHWKQFLLAIIVAVVTVTPAAIFYKNHPQGQGYFQRTSWLYREDLTHKEQAMRFAKNYSEFFSQMFLFERGDSITRHAVRSVGELLPLKLNSIIKSPPHWAAGHFMSLTFLLMLTGAAVALVWPTRASKLILWWLALYPAGASLMNEIPTATRAFIGVPAFCLLGALGLAAILKVLGWIGHWRPVQLILQGAGLAGFLALFIPDARNYLYHYFYEYPKYSAPTYGGFQYGYRDSIAYMETERKNYDLLMLTATEVNQPQIFPLFYNKMDPLQWSKTQKLTYLISDPAFYADYQMNQKILYQLRTQDLAYFNDYTIKKRIIAPGGQEEFVIAEVRSRKNFLTSWLALGLFSNANNEGVKKDFIDVRNISKDRYQGAFGDIYWRQLSQRNVRVDFNGFYGFDPKVNGNPEWLCAYGITTVRAEREQKAFLELAGTNDPMRVWLNGQDLTPFPISLSSNATRREIDLAKGDNVLVVKSCESVGDWYFTARITDSQGADVPGIKARAEVPIAPLPSTTATEAAAAQTDIQMVEGFGEIKRYKSEGNYADYRGSTQSWWSYVRDPEGEVVWSTGVPKDKKPTMFALTVSTSPDVGDAELYVNGKFAVPLKLGNRGIAKWERGPYKVTLLFRAEAAGLSQVAVISIPAEDIIPGQPLELRVVPSGGTPEAWFMLKNYKDTLTFENLTPAGVTALEKGEWQESPKS